MTDPLELIPANVRAKWAAELPSDPVTIPHLGRFVRGRQINPRTLARLLLVEAELEEARALLAAPSTPRPGEPMGGLAYVAKLDQQQAEGYAMLDSYARTQRHKIDVHGEIGALELLKSHLLTKDLDTVVSLLTLAIHREASRDA